LFLSIIPLVLAVRALGRWKRVGTFLRHPSKGGPYSKGRDLRRHYVSGGTLFALLMIGFLSRGLPGLMTAPLVALYFLGFPLLTWRYLSVPIARFTISYVVQGKLVNRLLSIISRSERKVPRVFFAEQVFTASVGWRFFQVILLCFSLSSVILPNITSLTVSNQIAAGGFFIIIGIAVLAIPGLAYVILWLYTDSGLRIYAQNDEVVEIPASKIINLITGFAGIGTFLSVIEKLGGGLGVATAIAFVISFFLLSPILLVVTIFHHRLQDNLLTKLRSSRIAEKAQIAIKPDPD
jgi:hypothetical protein